MEELKPGLYTTPPTIQENTPRLHQSLAGLLVGRSPLHCWFQAFGDAEEETTEATDLGQLCHSLLLGGKDIVSVEADDWRTKAAREFRDTARAEGKLPVLAHKLAAARILQTKVIAILKERGIELTGQSEVTAIWTSRGGTKCQGRMDHFIQKSATIYDFKFVQSANPEAIGRAMINYGYDIQCAAYTEAIETIFPQLAGRVNFVFPFIEPEPPHAVTLATPAGDMRALGNWKWDRACRLWREHLEEFGTKTPWPGYPIELQEIHPPAWALNEQVVEETVRQMKGE